LLPDLSLEPDIFTLTHIPLFSPKSAHDPERDRER
jgi:hypothetical protein